MIQTPALQYIQSKGWSYKASGDEKVELEVCPFCKKDNYGHFYMVIANSARDGLYMCHRCGTSGNLSTLKESQGDKIQGVQSRQEWSKQEVETLPNIEEAHDALLNNEEALDYLINVRGFRLNTIRERKIGYGKRFFRECGEVPAILYPYFVAGNCVFVHWRTLPTETNKVKAFSSPKGWDAPLYNGEILNHGVLELSMVEGEANTIAALDHGIKNIVGVPGANFKKALWIDQLNTVTKVYICYDKDAVGQKAAQTLASRIGIEKCYKVVLPDFNLPDGKPGKDLNEWFLYGSGTAEKWEQLKQEAQLFDVLGVSSSMSAVDELEASLEGKDGLKPTYDTPWSKLNYLIGFEDGDVIDVVAPEKVGKSTFGMNLMEYEVDKTGEDGIIICLEMPVVRMARKWVSHVTGFNDSIPKTDEEAKLKLQLLREAIPVAKERAGNRQGNLYFCYPPQIKDVEDVYKLIIDCIRRYGVKWVMFDNLQLLCDRTLKNNGHRTIHLSQISKTFAGIAKDYGIKFIRILQPHRIKDGNIVSTDDVDGSSQVAKDCDCMMALWRNKLAEPTQKEFEGTNIETDASFDPRLLVNVGLTRYSAGGSVTLDFDGATSTVRQLDTVFTQKYEPAKPIDGYQVPKEEVVGAYSGY